MKKITLFFLILVSFTSCFNLDREPDVIDPFIQPYDPVIMKRTELNSSIKIENNKEVIESSKIYIIGDYIFINDKHRGFHIFDNSDAANPVKKKFFNFPGATDIAIRNNTLYVNQATDLVALTFNFSDFTFKIEKRVENVFPELRSPEGDFYFVDDKEEVIVNWLKK